MYNAVDIAKWFLENNLDNPRNNLNGNIKLQKLMFFSQLIYIALYDKYLINDNFNAYEHGMVMESIRIKYKDNMNSILEEGNTNILSEEALNALNLTKELYGDADAEELSSMSHEFNYWKTYYKKSDNGIYKSKKKSLVPNEELKKDIENIRNVLKANEIIKKNKNKPLIELDY
ncbi:MAG: DUF4065 domain-containing protein [Bacilli bacterium]